MTRERLDLYVQTPQGVFVRRVQPPLFSPRLVTGHGIEGATRTAAAFWGLPDFVFKPVLQARGSSNREIGDVIVIVGDRAVVLQVKVRQSPSSLARREQSW